MHMIMMLFELWWWVENTFDFDIFMTIHCINDLEKKTL
jgi:hypothetical protein